MAKVTFDDLVRQRGNQPAPEAPPEAPEAEPSPGILSGLSNLESKDVVAMAKEINTFIDKIPMVGSVIQALRGGKPIDMPQGPKSAPATPSNGAQAPNTDGGAVDALTDVILAEARRMIGLVKQFRGDITLSELEALAVENEAVLKASLKTWIVNRMGKAPATESATARAEIPPPEDLPVAVIPSNVSSHVEGNP